MELQSPRPKRLSLQDLDRLLGGEDSKEVHALLEEWRASGREGDDPLAALVLALNASFELPSRARDDILRRASEILDGTEKVSANVPPRGVFKKQTLRQAMWPIAATFVLGIVVTVFGWTVGVHHLGRHVAQSSLTYTTGNGERATITLPDGGTVMLNVASRLEVPMDYMAGNHTVKLVGEGLFTVLHHSGIPLTVLAGPATVRILGTSFLVRNYVTDSSAMVAVRDGKVAIRSVVLAAAQQVTVGRAGPGQVQVADPAQFNFAKGVLTLDGMSFPEAIVELDRWYDADIRLGDPKLATFRMAGEFGVGSLAELSDNLVNTYKVRVVRNGRVLTLYPGR